VWARQLVGVSKPTWLVSATSLVFIVLQSVCTAAIAISGIRVAIGLSALAEATIGIHAPAGGFHRDAIRIPMMIAATVGSPIKLYVIWRIRTLRAPPSSVARADCHVKAATIGGVSDCACDRYTYSCGVRVDHASYGSSGFLGATFLDFALSVTF
jgi:hypothetical protein